MTFFPSDRLPDDPVSSVSQSDFSDMPRTHRGSITFILTNINSQNQANDNFEIINSITAPDMILHLYQATGRLSTWCGVGFCRLTYPVSISVGVTLNTLLTVVKMYDTGTRSNLINDEFLPPAWTKFVKPMKGPQSQTGTIEEAMKVEVFLHLFIFFNDLRVPAYFGIV